ncbi:MAG: hypothetical protein IK066_08490 [Kiritimatiellae bacterium]|nr:hypothetical protein [Kiritimatiellia bacterium]
MRRIWLRSLVICLAAVAVVGLYAGWRAWDAFRTAKGGYEHLRYLLESGETIEGAEAEDVLSDDYLSSLFGGNPELVEKLKSVIDLGMATDESLKTGEVTAMIVTYREGEEGGVKDAAIYAIGGFTDPKHTRLGFHSTGFMKRELDNSMWMTGDAVMRMLGRDIVVFCETDTAEEHMAMLYDLLNGNVLPLAAKVAESPLHYAVVFPTPGQIAPPSLKNDLQTLFFAGVMSGDDGSCEARFVTTGPLRTMHVRNVLKDMMAMARVTFRDKWGGYIKEREWGKMNDMWWAVDYVDLIDRVKFVEMPDMVVLRTETDREKNNAVLKTLERAGRDLAAQKAFALSQQLPWELRFEAREQGGGYWGKEHKWGPDWPLGDEGIPTPGSIAAAAERERARAAEEERKAKEAAEKAGAGEEA